MAVLLQYLAEYAEYEVKVDFLRETAGSSLWVLGTCSRAIPSYTKALGVTERQRAITS